MSTSLIETTEAGIVARIKDQVTSLSQAPGECRGINNVASVMTLASMTTPSALVAFAGESASESPMAIGDPSARLEWRWSIFVVAKSFTDEGEGRLGTLGAYQLIDDIFDALQGYGFSGTETRLFYVGARRFRVIDGRVLYEMTFRHHMIRQAT